MSLPSFEQPIWLIALPPLIALIFALVRVGRPAGPRRQHRWAVAIRIAAVIAVVLGAARPTLVLEVSERSVLFVLDRSASVPAEVRTDQDVFVADAMRAAGPADLSGVAVFGSELRVDSALAIGRIGEPARTSVGESSTNIEASLRAALALMPTEG